MKINGYTKGHLFFSRGVFTYLHGIVKLLTATIIP
jgi:hypothetical protein